MKLSYIRALIWLFAFTAGLKASNALLEGKLVTHSLRFRPFSSRPRILDDADVDCNWVNRQCTAEIDKDKYYAYELGPQTSLSAALDLEKDNNDLTINYISSLQSSLINPKITLSTLFYGQKSITIPNGVSWSLTISKEVLNPYNQLILSVNNESRSKAIIYFIMFNESNDSQGSSSFSILGVAIPIIGTILCIALISGCIYRIRRRRQARYAFSRAHRAIARAELANFRNSQANVRINRQLSIHYAPVVAENGVQMQNNDTLTAANLNERFPAASFEHFKSSFPQTTCSICLEELQKGTLCRQLYCEHIFHSECVRLWLENQLSKGNAFCPNCNKSVMEKDSIVRKQVE